MEASKSSVRQNGGFYKLIFRKRLESASSITSALLTSFFDDSTLSAKVVPLMDSWLEQDDPEEEGSDVDRVWIWYRSKIVWVYE